VSPTSIAEIMEAQDWQAAVLKPVSSQSGHGVQKLVWAERNSWSLDERTADMLLQEFQADIASLGETTMTFIDGVFSHAVRRVLKPGEWRANPQFGITYERVTATQDMIDAGASYLAHLQQTPLYARVDGIARDRSFMLTELELIEPYLYCEFAPGSAERIARAVLRRLG
jgi:glutathione synthase/RimK-type ligase-like ATP-grasp enzyme